MKKCQLCGHVEDEGAETCSMCGEATWEAMEVAPVPSLSTEETPKKGRKKP